MQKEVNIDKLKAFTLIELSIVLVIIGLIVGGVLVGQDLIKAAEMRAILSQKESFNTAANTFRLKYNCIPGDCDNATTFWGTMGDAGPGSCPATVGTSPETCNGNGDKMIKHTGTSNERFTYWQHLSSAGLIEGNYEGVQGSGGSYHGIGGQNVPTGKRQGTTWLSWHSSNTGGASYFTFQGHSNIFTFGTAGVGSNLTSALTASEAWGIDQKIDDGMPGTGKVIGFNRTTCADSTSQTDYSANYRTTTSDKRCALIFKEN